MKPLNKEERLKQLQDRREKDLFNALVSALNKRSSLSADEWNEFRLNARKQRLFTGDQHIFTAIKSLDISQNPVKIAKSFVAAFNIDENVIVKRTFIDLYSAKAATKRLTEKEEDELIKM